MKLVTPNRGSSFYESFSDLIFGTMAIFVLLMIVFLTMINQADAQKREELEKQVKQMAEELASTTAERDSSRAQAQALVEQMSKLERAVRAKGLQLVIAVDVSASMTTPLTHLVETINTIANILPKISPEFKVGIVAYRRDQDGSLFKEFPLRQIYSIEKDAGSSIGDLTSFMNSLKAQAGAAPVEEALDRSIEMLTLPGSTEGYRALMILGDVGPYEYGGNFVYDPSDKPIEERTLAKVAQWVRRGERHRIVSMFSGTRLGGGESPEALEKYEASRRFFEALATDAGQKENFTENPARMLVYLLNSIVAN